MQLQSATAASNVTRVGGREPRGGAGKNKPRSFGFCPSNLGFPPKALPPCLAVKKREASLICCEKFPRPSLTHGKVTGLASCCLTKEKITDSNGDDR